MTTELDLDINNYSVRDIENLFKFKPNSNYTQSDIELREYEMRQQHLANLHINKKLKSDIISFLNEAKNRLIDIKCKMFQPTSIPQDYKLDPDDYPRSASVPPREDNMLEKQQIPFTYTQPGDYYPGILNPIEKRIMTKVICIDTLFRPNYSKSKSTDFIYTLPIPINNVVSLQLTAIEIPRMWNSFSTTNKNNFMIINMYNICKTDDRGNIILDSSGNTIFTNYQFTITIPDGNYMNDTFQIIINNILFNKTVDDFGNETIALRFINVAVNPVTTCTIIRANNVNVDTIGTYVPPCPYDIGNRYYSPDFYFTVNFNILPEEQRPLYKNLGWMLGFRKPLYTVTKNNTYISFADNPLNYVKFYGYLQSESSYGSVLDNYVFVEVDDYHNNFPTDTIISMNDSTSSYLGRNIIARVTLTSGSATIITDNASDQIFKKREFFGPVKFEKMHIRLLNRFGDVIDLIQNDFSFMLELKQLYAS